VEMNVRRLSMETSGLTAGTILTPPGPREVGLRLVLTRL